MRVDSLMTNLIASVYLNQKLIVDLLSMLEGGIATVTGVTRLNGPSLSGVSRLIKDKQ